MCTQVASSSSSSLACCPRPASGCLSWTRQTSCWRREVSRSRSSKTDTHAHICFHTYLISYTIWQRAGVVITDGYPVREFRAKPFVTRLCKSNVTCAHTKWCKISRELHSRSPPFLCLLQLDLLFSSGEQTDACAVCHLPRIPCSAPDPLHERAHVCQTQSQRLGTQK